ncbi:MAG: hypothetical protein V1735_03395 [Nanoarchaeota archaeon]
MGLNRLVMGLLLAIVLGCSLALASATIDWVKIDNDELDESGTNFIRDMERGDEFEVKVSVTGGNATVDNAQIEATIKGSHNDDIRDTTDTFDIKAGVTYVKKLTLTLPSDMDQDSYKLRVRLEDRDGVGETMNYDFEIDTVRNSVIIRDVVFNPDESVMAGRSLLTVVRLKNLGEKDEEGIKVRAEILDLGVAASDFIDTLDADEGTTSEELYMRIPNCAEPGEYDVKVTVSYDDGDKSTTKVATIMVTKDEACGQATQPGQTQDQTIVSVPTSQRISVGSGAVYPITITNTGSQAKTYALAVSGIDAWGTFRIDPTNVLVVGSGETKTALVYVNAKDDAAVGTYTFGLSVQSGSETKVANMEAVVQEGSQQQGSTGWTSVKKGLEIALVVLVVVLVILGLIIGFNKLRGDGEDEEQEKSQTYY